MDGLVSWLKTNGASSGAMADLHDQFLTSQGYTEGSLDDRWDALLTSLGYTGSLQDKLYAFWQAGGTIGGGFDPSTLFAAGEVGFWYDMSDLNTMYSTVASTTPVALEEQVGLILDKKEGLAFGNEETTNGEFDTDSDWNKFGNITWSGGEYTIRNSPVLFGGARISQQLSGLTTGQIYRVTIEVTDSAVAANQASFWQGATDASTTYGITYIPSAFFTGTWSFNIKAGAANPWITIHVNGSNEYITVDSITIKEILGNHAEQGSSANRPTLRARYNLLSYSEQFNNIAWGKSNVTISPDTETAPDGTTTADTWSNSSTSYPSTFQTNVPVIGLAQYVFSVYAKAGTHDVVSLELRFASGDNTNIDASFNLSTGVATSLEAGVTASSTALADGWYRLTMVKTNPSTGSTAIPIIGGSSTAVGSVGSTGLQFYIWGAQVISSDSNATINGEYQSIAAANSYDSDATKFKKYLAFDGTNDSLATAPLDFTGTDKISVFAGLTKLRDGITAVLAELSVASDTNNGAFGVFAPSASGTNKYSAYYKGTLTQQGALTTSTSFSRPNTSVLSGLFDIGAPSVSLRLNGSLIDQNTTSVGTGNFGSYPLYIGARAGSSLRLQGRLYSLIVRGSSSTAQEISDAETYVAQKTGVTI